MEFQPHNYHCCPLSICHIVQDFREGNWCLSKGIQTLGMVHSHKITITGALGAHGLDTMGDNQLPHISNVLRPQ
jgi:hypothetical protein